ncbi:unnamed protein product [Caenorhabditis angaria]|uniref:Uncharacterized protein n=1 Tax=Caenorhabditis angaria TaxID=860376 RepID=A0A9P1ICN8_9PELO|nr:unnamed protein product [Caenorhabditis angaria]
MKYLTGFVMWIAFSTFIISCFSKDIPQKRRMVLRLPFVNQGSNLSGGQRVFRTFVVGNGPKSKKSEKNLDILQLLMNSDYN